MVGATEGDVELKLEADSGFIEDGVDDVTGSASAEGSGVGDNSEGEDDGVGFMVKASTEPSAKQPETRGWWERVVRNVGEKNEKRLWGGSSITESVLALELGGGSDGASFFGGWVVEAVSRTAASALGPAGKGDLAAGAGRH